MRACHIDDATDTTIAIWQTKKPRRMVDFGPIIVMTNAVRIALETKKRCDFAVSSIAHLLEHDSIANLGERIKVKSLGTIFIVSEKRTLSKYDGITSIQGKRFDYLREWEKSSS